MALDIYVGSLTRYYAGDWQTVAQQWAQESGVPFHVVRPDAPDDAVTDPDEIRPAVLDWRDQLSEALGARLDEPLGWDEGPSAPFFTDRPAWDGYGAVLLWAAYQEHPELPRPATVTAESWPEDPAYQASSASRGKTGFRHLLRSTELWLPASFDFTFATQDVAGADVAIGSAPALLRELAALNAATWNADAPTLADWRRDGVDESASLEEKARFGFAVFEAMTREAVRHRLPMKLDY